MARIRHIALVVKDLEKTATFYQQALGLSRSEMSEGPTARRIYMSDGEVNLALLQYKSEVGSGLKDPNAFVGVHHFGFQVDDLKEGQQAIEAAGGEFFFDWARRRRRLRAQVQGSRRHHLRHQRHRLGDDVGQEVTSPPRGWRITLAP